MLLMTVAHGEGLIDHKSPGNFCWKRTYLLAVVVLRNESGKLVARRRVQTMARSSSVAFQRRRSGRGNLSHRPCATCARFRR